MLSGIGFALIISKLNKLSKEKGHPNRNRTTPHNAYENIFGAFCKSSLAAKTTRMT